jgi:hypothetical protein
MRLIRPAAVAALLLLLAGCGTAPEDVGRDYGQTIRNPGAPVDYEGVSADQYAACISRSIDLYDEDTDQTAFIDACVTAART